MLTPSRLLPILLVAAAAVLGAPAVAGADTAVPGEVVVRYVRGRRPGGRPARDRRRGRARVRPAHARVEDPRRRERRRRPSRSCARGRRSPRRRRTPIARISGFIPSDPGTAGTPGGWQELQWNFLAGVGVNAPDAWQHLIAAGRPGGRGVVVAVLDTGVAYADRKRFRRSPDFRRKDFVRGYDFVDDDRFPNDENGHGTHVASTIGESTHNGTGVTGLAYGARIMPVRVLDGYGAGDSVDITAGIRYAVRHGADVINLSFEFDDGYRQVSAGEIPDILAALRYARRHNVLVVAAAGNQSRTDGRLPGPLRDGDRRRRDHRARLPRRLLQHRPRARHRRARRRAGRTARPGVPGRACRTAATSTR